MFKKIATLSLLLMTHSVLAVGNGNIYGIYLDSSLKTHQVKLDGVKFSDSAQEKLTNCQYTGSLGNLTVPGYISQPTVGRAATIVCMPNEYDHLAPGTSDSFPVKIDVEMDGKVMSVSANLLFDPWSTRKQYDQTNYEFYVTEDGQLGFRQLYN